MAEKISWWGGSQERLCLEEFIVNKEADIETAIIDCCGYKAEGYHGKDSDRRVSKMP